VVRKRPQKPTVEATETVIQLRSPSYSHLEQSMDNSAATKEVPEAESAELVTRNMVAMGRKRSRGQRLLKTVITIVALTIAAVIFANIYFQTLEPGFEWKWLK